MKVCMILEGCYPYVYGGVSSWMHQYIQAMPNIEFALWCIGANRKDQGKFKFTLPENVVEVREVFLDDALELKLHNKRKDRIKLSCEQKEALKSLFIGKTFDWDILFKMFQEQKVDPISLLMCSDFLEVLMDICRGEHPYISFSEYFHTVRSMLLPVFYMMAQEVPQADIYHATATGYSGILGSLGKWKNGVPFLLTEHGIYTREREEELLRASWVFPYFRKQWIKLFYSFSSCAYGHADRVTALFHGANETQAALGCEPWKLSVIGNGVHYERFCKIPLKKEDGWIDIGAVVRLAKIKDIKTMIYAFAEVKNQVKNARLHIMGDTDDKEYGKECHQLVQQLQIKDILFTGVVNVIEYMEKIDFTILTSISEGQPLSVLESFAAGRPCVTTDVGCCVELVEGQDEFGDAGIVVPPMHKEELALAIIRMCKDKEMRLKMGVEGKKRTEKYFTHEISMDQYRKLYKEVYPAWQV